MQRPDELKKHPQTLEAFSEMSKGNPQVMAILWSFWSFSQCLDDLIDGSGWDLEKKEQAMKTLHDFVTDLMLNPFVLQNAQSIHGAFVSAMTRNMDGDMMKSSTDAYRDGIATAVRCGDIDVIMHLAYLASGWAGLREVSKWRDYDNRDQPGKDPNVQQHRQRLGVYATDGDDPAKQPEERDLPDQQHV